MGCRHFFLLRIHYYGTAVHQKLTHTGGDGVVHRGFLCGLLGLVHTNVVRKVYTCPMRGCMDGSIPQVTGVLYNGQSKYVRQIRG